MPPIYFLPGKKLTFLVCFAGFALYSMLVVTGTIECHFKCPKDNSYDKACLRSAVPPWPICLFHTVAEFVKHAQDSATRCCGDDISHCRCPRMKSKSFKNHIGEWCKGVASCGSIGNGDTEEAIFSSMI